MKDKFNSYIDGISADFWRELCITEGQMRRYERGEEFVTSGSVGKYLGFIEKGTFKYIARSNAGSEHVIGFEFAGEFIADFPFSLSGIPARVSIVAESQSEVHCIAVAKVVEMMKSDEHIRKITAQSTEAIFSTVYDRYVSLYTQSPQQRYSSLIDRHPNLFTLFSLHDIASYLNITPTHLSRIRRLSNTNVD